MKKTPKASLFSSFIPRLLLCGAVMVLAGCADTKLPTFFTGEPGEEVTANPRVTASPVDPLAPWPNVADVPDVPAPMTTPEEWSVIKESLLAEQRDNTLTKARMQATAPSFEAPLK